MIASCARSGSVGRKRRSRATPAGFLNFAPSAPHFAPFKARSFADSKSCACRKFPWRRLHFAALGRGVRTGAAQRVCVTVACIRHGNSSPFRKARNCPNHSQIGQRQSLRKSSRTCFEGPFEASLWALAKPLIQRQLPQLLARWDFSDKCAFSPA
jgi:hypothetical protein